MAFIDGSVLTVALPRLRAAVGADLASVAWVVNGYLLALASLTLIGGALADVYGKARMLSIGCLLFGAASVGCALAPSVSWLIAARIVEGVAAALLTPASLALIGATYPKDERNRVIAVWAAASALTTAAGPVLGGWLTETFGWQAVFWINPPLSLAAIGVICAFAPEDRRLARRFDSVGAAVIAVSLGALALALSRIGGGESRPPAASMPDTATILAAVAGVLGLAAYALWERHSAEGMTPPRLMENRVFLGLNVATILLYAGLSMMFFLMPFDLVDRRGLPPIDAGMAFLPFTVGVGLLSRPFGSLADAIGARAMLIAGPAGASAAFVWMAFGQGTAPMPGVIAPMALLGISFAVLVAPLTASVMSSVAAADEGLAAGINNATGRVAQLAGVAIGAGVGSLMSGYQLGFMVAAAASAAGALTIAATSPPK
jgi:EmrB/QacA subfamily drug resistance transporter